MDKDTISLYVNTESTYFYEYILTPNKLDFDSPRSMYFKWPGYDSVKLVANRDYVYCWAIHEKNPWDQRLVVYKRRERGGDGFSYWSLSYSKFYPISTSESLVTPFLDILEITNTGSTLRSYETGGLKLIVSKAVDQLAGELRFTGSSSKNFVLINVTDFAYIPKDPVPEDNKQKGNNKSWIVVLCVVAAILFISIAVVVYFLKLRKPTSSEDEEYSRVENNQDGSTDQTMGDLDKEKL